MDIALLDAIQEHLRSPFMDTLMLSVTYLGDLAVVWFLAAAVLAASSRRRTYAPSSWPPQSARSC